MLVDFNFDYVLDYEFNAEGDDIYTISILFNNEEAFTYGYTDKKEWIKDCSKIADKVKRGV